MSIEKLQLRVPLMNSRRVATLLLNNVSYCAINNGESVCFTFEFVLPNHMLAQVSDVCTGPVTHTASMRLLSLVSAHVGVTD